MLPVRVRVRELSKSSLGCDSFETESDQEALSTSSATFETP
jgi:hypothetical protein